MNANLVFALVVVTCALTACEVADASPPHAVPATAAPPPSSSPATDVASGPPVLRPSGAVLIEVEHMRAALAADTAEPLAASLVALKQATAELKASGNPFADAVAKGAAAIDAALPKNGATADLKAVRTAYGELSHAAVDMVTADPALQRGRTLFECPMAPGYKRWVQPSAKMANPYMGTRMLECGSVIVGWQTEAPPSVANPGPIVPG